MSPDTPNGNARAVAPGATVVLNTFNRAAVLPRALDAVVAQEWAPDRPPFEVVVVDDGSTDDTRDVVARYRDDRVRYVWRENGGLSNARNTGLEAARGDYVVFLDDDDEPAPAWLETLYGLATGEGAAVASCGIELVAPDGGVTTRVPEDLGPVFGGVRGLFVAGAFMARRDALEAIGGYLPGLRTNHQTELALRLVPWCGEHGERVVATDRALVRMRRAAPEDRPLRSPEGLFEGTTTILDLHRDRIARSPRMLASFLGVAGVSAARMERWDDARRLLGDAVRVRPGSWRAWARLVMASVRPLGRRVWRTRVSDAAAGGAR